MAYASASCSSIRFQYPSYLAKPPAPLSAEDRARYEAQSSVVSEIVATFDNPKFDNGTESEKRELKSKVQELMNEVGTWPFTSDVTCTKRSSDEKSC